MNAYNEIINNYVNLMRKELGKKISVLFMIGSSCSNKVIEGWSDIDSIVVLDNYDEKTIEKIQEITNEFSVKIGVTIYNDDEFLNKKIDAKTKLHLLMVKEGEISIQYIKKNYKLPFVDFNEVKNNYIDNFYFRLHNLKRYFFYKNIDKQKAKELFKIVYLVLKDILIIDGYRPKNYDEVFKLYSEKKDFEYYDYEQFITNYMNDNIEYLNIIDYAKKVLFSIIK